MKKLPRIPFSKKYRRLRIPSKQVIPPKDQSEQKNIKSKIDNQNPRFNQ